MKDHNRIWHHLPLRTFFILALLTAFSQHICAAHAEAEPKLPVATPIQSATEPDDENGQSVSQSAQRRNSEQSLKAPHTEVDTTGDDRDFPLEQDFIDDEEFGAGEDDDDIDAEGYGQYRHIDRTQTLDDDDDDDDDVTDDFDESDDLEYQYENEHESGEDEGEHWQTHAAETQATHDQLLEALTEAESDEEVYMAFFKSEDLGTDAKAISVRVNGVVTAQVVLYNSTTISFRVPAHMVHDRLLFAEAYVEIHVQSLKLANIPLSTLEQNIVRIDLARLRMQAPETLNSDSNSESDAGILEDDDDDVDDDDDDNWQAFDSFEDMFKSALSLLQSKEVRSNERRARKLREAHLAGNAKASVTLASMYLTGPPGVQRNVSLAVDCLRSAGEKGNPDALALLGILHASGFATPYVEKDIGAALLRWTFAAEGGSDIAKMALAFRFYTGIDVTEDCEAAVRYYKDVADNVYDSVMESMGGPPGRGATDDERRTKEIRAPRPSSISMSTANRKYLVEGIVQRALGETNEVVRYYQHSADRGDAGSQVVMGSLYYYGAVDMKRDVARARYLFQQAAESGRMDAHAHLGFIDLGEGKNASALKHLREAAKKGDKLGLQGMGYVTLRGIGIEKNLKKAAHYFSLAVEKEDIESMFNLGVMYSKGVGVQHSIQDSMRLFKAAAKMGHIQSNYKLGLINLVGYLGVDRNCQQAARHFKHVSEMGMWSTVLSRALGSYERGRSGYANGLYRYLLAAHVGIEIAQYNGAFMYEHGHAQGAMEEGGERDSVEEAIELYSMSAAQRNSESLVRIGTLTFAKMKDYNRASMAYERAAKMKNAEAMFNLGLMHAFGHGMKADKHMAKRYFDEAIETDEDANIPATLALSFLRYSEYLQVDLDFNLESLNWKSLALGLKSLSLKSLSLKSLSLKSLSMKSLNLETLNWEKLKMKVVNFVPTAELLIVSALLFVLVLVVNARQRRLMLLVVLHT